MCPIVDRCSIRVSGQTPSRQNGGRRCWRLDTTGWVNRRSLLWTKRDASLHRWENSSIDGTMMKHSWLTIKNLTDWWKCLQESQLEVCGGFWTLLSTRIHQAHREPCSSRLIDAQIRRIREMKESVYRIGENNSYQTSSDFPKSSSCFYKLESPDPKHFDWRKIIHVVELDLQLSGMHKKTAHFNYDIIVSERAWIVINHTAACRVNQQAHIPPTKMQFLKVIRREGWRMRGRLIKSRGTAAKWQLLTCRPFKSLALPAFAIISQKA